MDKRQENPVCISAVLCLSALLAACQPAAPNATATTDAESRYTGVDDAAQTVEDAPRRYPAALAGQAMLPFDSRLQMPADLPSSMRLSGKFTHPELEVLTAAGEFATASFGSHPAAPRLTAVRLPIEGQALQGFSGMAALDDGTFIVTLDNGFGTRSNSRDTLLAFARLSFNWQTGAVNVLSQSPLHDPDGVLPFEIVNRDTQPRYLTGGDLDPESIQLVGSDVFIGEEFGPFLLRADLDGRITGFYEARLGDTLIRSKSDNPLADAGVARNLHGGSRGFEGMALSSDRRTLYLMLEGPLADPTTLMPERLDGQAVLRILLFDTLEQRFSADSYRYRLEEPGNSIGDFNFISEHEALVIERDSGEGDASLACGDTVSSDCFHEPARFKRVYKVSFDGLKSGDPVRKLAYIDLLDIRDGDTRFTFPFVTIENVVPVDDDHLIVANDNNFGFSVGRTLGQNDDNEFVLIEAVEFLRVTH
ncbi:MAG: esterase-like activity of phytase family protein [Pseudomonadota bacterium]